MVMIFFVSCNSATTPTDPTPGTTAPSTGDLTTPESGESEFPENGAEKIIPVTKKLYISSEQSDDILVAHYESTPEILLIDMDTVFTEFFAGILSKNGTYVYEDEETTLTIERDNGAYCIIDFVEDTLYFNNFDLFLASRSNTMADILGLPYVDSEGNSIYFQNTGSLDITGHALFIYLSERNIPLDIYEGKKYIPFQTFNDIFLSPFGYNFVYNSKDLFLAAGGSVDPALEKEYYSLEPTEKSQALAEFTANELCLLLDVFYGLQSEHGVVAEFDVFLKHAGLWDDLSSTDASKSSAALLSLAFGYLADKHSTLNKASPYSGTPDLDMSSVTTDASIKNYISYSREIAAARAQIMSEGTYAYQEIGNTAYVTFDSFTLDAALRSMDYSEQSKNGADTIGLIIYAHSMITRENSPIENVVLDLSCNGGGAADAAVYVVAWMLGYCDLHFTNPVTNSYSTASYKVDVNLDGVFDEKDSIADKNLFCLISPVSFSCGNLVPSLLKESGRVTLLGGTSGGGACAVQHVSTADGSLFQISSPRHLCVVSNGAYYTIDRGVEPHYYFGKFESYFDRTALTEYINGLK
jgi:hypothetical protein